MQFTAYRFCEKKSLLAKFQYDQPTFDQYLFYHISADFN